MREEIGMMNVTIRYFAAAAEAAGCEQEVLTFEPAATLSSLKTVLRERYGADMHRVLEVGSFLINDVVHRSSDQPLAERVDVLPPFAGG